MTLPDETISALIRGWTREAGLRRLERAIGRLMRKTALRFAEGNSEPVTVKPEDLSEMLGPEIFTQEQFRKNLPGGCRDGSGMDRNAAAMSSTSKRPLCRTVRA